MVFTIWRVYCIVVNCATYCRLLWLHNHKEHHSAVFIKKYWVLPHVCFLAKFTLQCLLPQREAFKKLRISETTSKRSGEQHSSSAYPCHSSPYFIFRHWHSSPFHLLSLRSEYISPSSLSLSLSTTSRSSITTTTTATHTHTREFGSEDGRKKIHSPSCFTCHIPQTFMAGSAPHTTISKDGGGAKESEERNHIPNKTAQAK